VITVNPSYRTVILGTVKLYCEGLAQRLAGTPLLVVDMATTWPEALDRIRRQRPQVVLMDASSHEFLPHVALLREVRDLVVVAFAVSEDEGDIIACAEAGVSAFVERSASIDDLVTAVVRGIHGELQLSPRAAATLFRRVGTLGRPDALPRGTRLTGREREILLMLRTGLSNKEIAASLGLCVPTVKNHVHRLLEKLGVHRRRDAIALTRP
jgi:two-component system, NarL family, nitrate/nitrite response regulator NarL